MPADELFTRDEALGGLPARRAATLLFLIESRSAHFEARARLEADEFATEKAAQELDLAFIEAFALSRQPPLRVTIQDLERHAQKWAYLIPDNARLRAAIARLLSEKYSFTSEAVPAIRSALGLDQPAVQRAYQGLYHQSIDTIFASRVALIERLRWISTSLAKSVDSLPPFWMTFTLVLTLSLPQAVLALPIATSGVGPLAGIVLLLFFGLINILTMACMAEAFARNGSIRYGSVFTGRVVSDYIGEAGSQLLVLATAVRLFIGLVACYYGLSITMAGLTPIRPSVWAALLFLLALYLLAGKSLNFSTALSALLGAISISLICVIGLAASSHIQWANVSYVNAPLIGGHHFERAVLQVVLGIAIGSYLAHAYLTQCAKVVLPRDPGGRSLIRGTTAASIATTVLLCGWVLVVNGAVKPLVLAAQTATVLTPLAREIGPQINIPGFFLVVLLLGLGFIRQSTVLFNLARERIPIRVQSTVVLPRRRASLLLSKNATPGKSPRLRLTYLGLSERQPLFRLDVHDSSNFHRIELKIDKSWDAAALLERFPELRSHGFSLVVEVTEAGPESARLRVTSSMNLKYEGEWSTPGLHVADLSSLRDPLRRLINWMTRRGEVSRAEITAYTGGNEWIAQLMIDELIEMGFVQRLEGTGDSRYQIRLAARHGRDVPLEIWRSLEETASEPLTTRPVVTHLGIHPMALWFRRVILNEVGRFVLSMSPVIGVFALTEWLIFTGTSSFTEVLAVGGLLGNSLVSGIFPVLLLASSRRKGDLVPDVVMKRLGHATVVTVIYLLFLGTLFLHAFIIWVNPAERAAAFVVGLLVIAATIRMVRQGAFTRRLVVEFKEDSQDTKNKRAMFNITASGQRAVAEVEMRYATREEKRYEAAGEVPSFADLRSVTFKLPATEARELKVWAHTITPDGASVSLPGVVEVQCENESRQFDLKLSDGQIVMPLTDGECWLRITLPEADSR